MAAPNFQHHPIYDATYAYLQSLHKAEGSVTIEEFAADISAKLANYRQLKLRDLVYHHWFEGCLHQEPWSQTDRPCPTTCSCSIFNRLLEICFLVSQDTPDRLIHVGVGNTPTLIWDWLVNISGQILSLGGRKMFFHIAEKEMFAVRLVQREFQDRHFSHLLHMLLACGLDPNTNVPSPASVDGKDISLLQFVLQFRPKCSNAVEALLQSGASVWFATKETHGYDDCALLYVGNLESTKLLLDHAPKQLGCRNDSRFGWNAIDHAICHVQSHPEVAMYLLQVVEANLSKRPSLRDLITLPDKLGNTLLMRVCIHMCPSQRRADVYSARKILLFLIKDLGVPVGTTKNIFGMNELACLFWNGASDTPEYKFYSNPYYTKNFCSKETLKCIRLFKHYGLCCDADMLLIIRILTYSFGVFEGQKLFALSNQLLDASREKGSKIPLPYKCLEDAKLQLIELMGHVANGSNDSSYGPYVQFRSALGWLQNRIKENVPKK